MVIERKKFLVNQNFTAIFSYFYKSIAVQFLRRLQKSWNFNSTLLKFRTLEPKAVGNAKKEVKIWNFKSIFSDFKAMEISVLYYWNLKFQDQKSLKMKAASLLAL